MKTTKRKQPTTKKVVKKNKNNKADKNNSVTYEAISVEAWDYMNDHEEYK